MTSAEMLEKMERLCVYEFGRRQNAVIDGFVYASDGRIVVRHKVEADFVLPPEPEYCEPLPETMPSLFGGKCIGNGTLPPCSRQMVPCRECGGRGKGGECRECRGSRTVVCEYGHTHDCPDCDGIPATKDAPCAICDGTGEVEDCDARIALVTTTGAEQISVRYASRLSEAGFRDFEVRFLSDRNQRVACFSHDGFEAVVAL